MNYNELKTDVEINRDMEDDARNKEFDCDKQCTSCQNADDCDYYNEVVSILAGIE